jgi:hypothetical protein
MYTKPQIPGRECNVKSGKSAQQHLTFNTKVEHTTTLAESLTDGSIQVGSG